MGRVIEKSEDCITVRSDDNRTQRFCAVDAQLGAEVSVAAYQPLSHLYTFHRVLYEETNGIDEEVIEALASMTLEEKLGQLLVVRTSENLSAPLDFVPAGYLLFANDFKDKNEEEIQSMTQSLTNQPYGVLLMVDEEGGKVNRISSQLYEEGFPSAQELYESGGWDAVKKNLQEKSELIRTLGLQVNLNPVADVSEDVLDYMHERTFGQNAELTAEYVKMAVEIQKNAGLVSCLKHFPGYGSNLDTHKGISVDYRSLSDFEQRDFLPFVSGIEADAEMVMMSHVIVSALDELPASLSLAWHQKLRELGFDGVIISDDLTMDALDEMGENVLVMALLAGNDLLITTDPDITLDALIGAVKNGQISLNQIEKSVARVLQMKKNAHLW